MRGGTLQDMLLFQLSVLLVPDFLAVADIYTRSSVGVCHALFEDEDLAAGAPVASVALDAAEVTFSSSLLFDISRESPLGCLTSSFLTWAQPPTTTGPQIQCSPVRK